MSHNAPHHGRHEPPLSHLLFQAWCEAAAKWKRLRSDPAMAACVAARGAWYHAVYGEVPPIHVAAGIEGALGIGDHIECVSHRSYTDGGGEVIGFEEDDKGRRRYRIQWASGKHTSELRSRIRRVPRESEVAS